VQAPRRLFLRTPARLRVPQSRCPPPKSELRNHCAIVQPRNHCAIVQPRWYDSAMVTQTTLKTESPSSILRVAVDGAPLSPPDRWAPVRNRPEDRRGVAAETLRVRTFGIVHMVSSNAVQQVAGSREPESMLPPESCAGTRGTGLCYTRKQRLHMTTRIGSNTMHELAGRETNDRRSALFRRNRAKNPTRITAG
jgi:hypothetical protein